MEVLNNILNIGDERRDINYFPIKEDKIKMETNNKLIGYFLNPSICKI